MGLLYDLSTKYKTLSIVGMAKNAGKTTALNYLIEEAIDEGILLGVTSTGRDGESQDLVTGTEKPRVYLDQDMLVAVPSLLYDLADARPGSDKENKIFNGYRRTSHMQSERSGIRSDSGPGNKRRTEDALR